jgi:flagellar basal-body rod protein FlgB
MLEGIALFRLASDRMQYLAERQALIARNIANADTPNYVARDLTSFTFDSALAAQSGGSVPTGGKLAMTLTSGGHLGGAEPSASASSSFASSGYGEKPDGNQVSIEEQMVKAADNTNAFALVSAAYSKSISIMKMSIDK